MNASVATQSPRPETAWPISRRRKPVVRRSRDASDWPEVGMCVGKSYGQAAWAESGRPVEMVDSTNASMAEGFVAIEAARAASAGAALADVVGRAREVAARTRIFATIDTFEFLKRSGRVRKVQAYAATMLNIKPVFRFQDGDAEGIGRPRTRGRALDRIVEETLREAGGRTLHLAAFHALAEEDA